LCPMTDRAWGESTKTKKWGEVKEKSANLEKGGEKGLLGPGEFWGGGG